MLNARDVRAGNVYRITRLLDNKEEPGLWYCVDVESVDTMLGFAYVADFTEYNTAEENAFVDAFVPGQPDRYRYEEV